MKTTVDSDLMIDASEEAKICLNCEKEKCNSTVCKIFKQKKKELKQKETAVETEKKNNHCPLSGDESNDCADCAYSEDYHFVDGECVRRKK